MRFPKIIKKGYTMTEAIVALTLIGIVAVIVIFKVILNHDNEYEAKFKKVSAAIEANIKSYKIQRTGVVDEDFVSHHDWFVDAVKTGLDFKQENCDVATCWSSMTSFDNITIANNKDNNWNINQLTDETVIAIAPNSVDIYIDVNGLKGPNKYGQDIRKFNFLYQNDLNNGVGKWCGPGCGTNKAYDSDCNCICTLTDAICIAQEGTGSTADKEKCECIKSMTCVKTQYYIDGSLEHVEREIIKYDEKGNEIAIWKCNNYDCSNKQLDIEYEYKPDKTYKYTYNYSHYTYDNPFITSYTYDEYHNLIAIINESIGRGEYYRYKYNLDGTIKEYGEKCAGLYTSYTCGTTTKYSYSADGKIETKLVCDPYCSQYSYQYDDKGNVTSEIKGCPSMYNSCIKDYTETKYETTYNDDGTKIVTSDICNYYVSSDSYVCSPKDHSVTTYDSHGNIISVYTCKYVSVGNIECEYSTIKEYTYYENGHIKAIKDCDSIDRANCTPRVTYDCT